MTRISALSPPPDLISQLPWSASRTNLLPGETANAFSRLFSNSGAAIVAVAATRTPATRPIPHNRDAIIVFITNLPWLRRARARGLHVAVGRVPSRGVYFSFRT